MFQRSLYAARLKASAKMGIAFGVSMGLAYVPNSLLSLAEPSDSRWHPLIMGLLNGTFMFAFYFGAASRSRWKLFGDQEQMLRDIEQLAQQEARETAERQGREAP
jgi:hypothetical protein